MSDLTKLVEQLAAQALSGQQNNNSSGGLGGILGGVLGQLGGQSQNQTSSGAGGILGSILGQFTGNNSAGGNASSLLVAVLPLILNWIQQQGGLNGALDKLRTSGLADQVQSWVDPNQSNQTNVSPDQVQSLFNDQDIQNVAEQTQSQPQDIYAAIASVIPQVIDHLTPKGEHSDTEAANTDIQNVLNIASQFFK
ncbi:YidB family protein [Acinetobacter sp. MD2(2019)]|uniref:YidB family protein n=1 Tax=Acinetobacter sp. MD2(2019) TaxID=2605273 RepID=UPI002D1EF585|nr:YidB family protein [Acinetobacter sp. MD2(2019)]MEB3752953.1 DUF937 domain-containing protein [Acinetobacter sp. MD2(2019)]